MIGLRENVSAEALLWEGHSENKVTGLPPRTEAAL